MECSPGKSATAVVAAMVPDSLADAEKDLDATAAPDDAKGHSLPCHAGVDCSGHGRLDLLDRLRRTRQAAGSRLAGPVARRQYDRSAYHRAGHGPLSPLGGSLAARCL